MSHDRPRLLARGSRLEAARIAELLRQETLGGILLIGAAAVALLAANVGDVYADVRDTVVGPSGLHLDLTIGAWASDGLLAIFFFVVGLELKRELVAGDLRDPRRAAVPIVAAVGGMVVPAVIYTLVNLGGATRGWAVPTATDIAFALAVLAALSTHLPSGLRTFLLTLAVVDDLLAISIIAVFYTDDLDVLWLLAAVVPIALFAAVVRWRTSPWLLVPLAVVAWACVHESGVHATVAGVVLGFTVPVHGAAERLEHVLRPLSAAVAVPVFAFFSAGVAIGGWSGLTDALSDRVTLGVVLGLVAGKTIGVLGATWLMARFTRADLDTDLSWWDVLGLSILAGIGFTVSLLIGELAFGPGSEADEHVKVGILAGSLVAAALAAVVLRARNRVYRRIEARERDDQS
ncbi:Na+/H+ antiporter NhaA [Aeromicrobium terrae]|uniref:Na(+)/H(+) antiporter NhaA n=1 Tax=Aeromicrobium terrae TaxID=2498846 RepID=A0A5C8NCD3_9ACTN|nr:Na+/H+ antiporter NhaA [Aeromicrobium terrae]TXL57247.1 Na+/H+ antiporter NhaA [Aeromicrobium terrae]